MADKCNHDDNKAATYLPVFDAAGEIYMCECGALFDIDGDWDTDQPKSMTPQEVEDAVRAVVDARLRELFVIINEHKFGEE